MLRWLRENFGTLALAFLLAITVWVAAVSQEDPIIERIFPQLIKINYTGLADGMQLVGSPPENASITIRAPESVWEEITSQDIFLEANLSDLEAGTYRVQLTYKLNLKPALLTEITPNVVMLTIEPSVSKEMTVHVVTFDLPALGYNAEDPIANPNRVTVVGPASAIEKVHELRAEINLTNLRESIDQEVPLSPLDEEGTEVEGIQILPDMVRVTVRIRLGSRYRLVSVIPKINGLEEVIETGHYQVTNIEVAPSEVIVFSSDRAALDALPGFVETMPLDITDQTQDITRRLPLNLPEGVSLVGEQSVLIQVTIVPVVESRTVTRRVEIQGLGPGLYAYPSPNTVDVILTGPAATLDTLQPEDVRVVLDLLDLGVGIYQLEPHVLVLPTDLEFDAPIPNTVEVAITTTPRPTPTATP